MDEYMDEKEISILDILIILAEQKKLILGMTLLFAVCGLAYAVLFTEVKYTSEVQMLPISSYRTDRGEFSIQIPGNIVDGVVSSNSMLDSVIDKFGLMKDKEGKTISRIAARKNLLKNIKVSTDQNNGVITLKAEAYAPEEAQEIASYIYKNTVAMLQQMGVVATVGNKDLYLDSTLRRKLDQIQSQSGSAADDTKLKNILELYAVLKQYDDNKRLIDKTPLVIELISPASLPDEKQPQGRGKIVLLSAILGLFAGTLMAFASHGWKTMEDDPETAAKKAHLRSLIGFKRG